MRGRSRLWELVEGGILLQSAKGETSRRCARCPMCLKASSAATSSNGERFGPSIALHMQLEKSTKRRPGARPRLEEGTQAALRT